MPTLLSGPLSMFGAKAEIALLEKGLDWTVEHVGFSLGTFYEPRHPDVLRVNPKGQVPVLLDGDLEIYDSTQIFEYLEDVAPAPALWPADPRARARARLAELESDEVFFAGVILQMPHMQGGVDAGRIASSARDIAAFYDRIEARLTDGRRWLAGEDFSYADIAFYMASYFAAFLGHPWQREHRHIGAWRARAGARASIERVAGTMSHYLAEAGLTPPPLV
jgi:glutathione S-transferase